MNVIIRMIMMAVVAGIAGLFGMSRTTQKKAVIGESGLVELRAPVPVAAMVVIGGLLFAGLGVVLLTQLQNDGYRGDGTIWWFVVAMLGFGAFYMFLGYRFGRARHRLVSGGIEIEKLIGPKQEFRWADLTSLEFKNKNFVLKSKDGRTGKLSVWLRGLPEFARDALAAVPPAAMTPKTLALMKTTAAGTPPGVVQF